MLRLEQALVHSNVSDSSPGILHRDRLRARRLRRAADQLIMITHA